MTTELKMKIWTTTDGSDSRGKEFTIGWDLGSVTRAALRPEVHRVLDNALDYEFNIMDRATEES